MEEGANQEGNEHSNGFREVGTGWEVDMAKEEIVDRDVPLAGELEPADVSMEEYWV